MSLEQWALVSEIVGAAAVIASLIYLAVQIKQNTTTVAANTFQAISSTSSNFASNILQSPETADVVFRAFTHGKLTDAKDRFVLDVFLRSLLRNFENYYYQNELGYLSNELWDGYEKALFEPLSQEFGREFWARHRRVFGRAFVSHVDARLKEGGVSEVLFGGSNNLDNAS